MNQIITSDSLQHVTGTPQGILTWFPVSETLSLIALALGCALIIIAYFTGARENKAKVLFSIISSMLIIILSMPLFLRLGKWLGILNSTWGAVTVLILALLFAVCVGVHAYEVVTVSAREARPPD